MRCRFFLHAGHGHPKRARQRLLANTAVRNGRVSKLQAPAPHTFLAEPFLVTLPCMSFQNTRKWSWHFLTIPWPFRRRLCLGCEFRGFFRDSKSLLGGPSHRLLGHGPGPRTLRKVEAPTIRCHENLKVALSEEPKKNTWVQALCGILVAQFNRRAISNYRSAVAHC